jgi:lactate dehydrogenase-like 2-hydroxyacid dehydrogenase
VVFCYSGGWEHWSLTYLNGKAIEGSVVGFYGMGRIGESVAHKVAAFHPQKIIYHNRKPKENSEPPNSLILLSNVNL